MYKSNILKIAVIAILNLIVSCKPSNDDISVINVDVSNLQEVTIDNSELLFLSEEYIIGSVSYAEVKDDLVLLKDKDQVLTCTSSN